jgi:VWFA-related protein
MARMTKWCVAVAVAAAALFLLVSRDVVAQQRFSERAEVLVVEIPVQVLHDGDPVRGLTKDDFEVLEGRKEQPIVGFDVIDLSLEDDGGAKSQSLPVAGRRHFLLLFDLSFSRPGSIVRARQAAQRLVAEALHPSDLVAVATYSSSQGIRIPLSFSSDRDQLRVAIDTLALPQLVQGARDPLGLILLDRANISQATPSTSGPDTGGGGLAGDRPSADVEVQELLSSIETATTGQARTNAVLALTASLKELADMMKAVEGRKHILYLSEGFESSAMLGTRGSTFDEQRAIMEQNEAAMRGDVSSVNSDARFGSTSTTNQVTNMLQAFVDSGTTIQAIDIGSLATGGDVSARGASDDAMFYLANETGGELYRNYNDLGQAMGEMLQRTSVTYLLAIQPDKVKEDGKYHRLKVQLKAGDRGMKLVHRPGYFAPTPYSELSAGQRRLSTAEQILSGQKSGEIDASVLATAFDYAPGSAYVPVLIEIDGQSFLAGQTGNAVPTEIYVYAIDSNGAVQDFITQAMALDLSKVGPALRQSGFKFWGNMELPPGDYSVRVVVRNAGTGSSGVNVTPVHVPQYASESTLLPPLFPEPGGKWLLAREQGAENDPYPYPFLMAGQPFIPAARPVLISGGQSQICLVGYNLGGGSLAARAELYSEAGDLMPDGVQLELQARPASETAGLDRLVASLTTNGVPAGSYNLVVSVRDTSSGDIQTSSIPVLVGG